MMDSSRSEQRADMKFLHADGEYASQIYRRMKEVCGQQCLARCIIFRWCERYETRHVNIKDLPRPGQAHVVTNSATILAVDELIRHNRRITTREIAVELSISKGTVHHIIHKSLVKAKFAHSGCLSICQRIRRRRDGNWIHQQRRILYTEAIRSLPTRWDQCINVNDELYCST
ncbi:hypothetical protein AVEN_31249-1 [Araneus ventricosus]|uniref:Mos1 transposase HTH domain-containing protein n=1 Tax=Araneus ventricosus TaxID=182803 RepID=A0A4Y2S6K4_ARAVE|nr:hypothetical protein AVEN_31249-1 [Araneus ventricosus]